MKLNVDKRKKCSKLMDKDVFGFPSMTGIYVGPVNVYQEYGYEGRLMRYDRERKEHDVILRNLPITMVTAVIPSSSSPSNLSRALYLFSNGGCNYRGSNRKQFHPGVHVGRFSSLVRIYKDVFLLCDEDNKWGFMRIVVP
eukprot:gnl/Chilomastix_caulleri/3514.p1 GENE.gnl/Chilomastix_caulleri/3514~~gnl/Chilomastix_caulleri/3514.p1  ORF type:complete len:140 (+),score=22.99 gnl/Chilomastix_caulleri/3514:145-564(+)